MSDAGVDRFPKSTAAVLERRAGQRCSICRCPTSGPHSDPNRSVSIGVAAHITAASAGGPRYDPSLSTAERRAPANGIWACQNHAHQIDCDLEAFTVGELQRLKARAEGRADQALGVPGDYTRLLTAPRNEAEVRLLEQQRATLQQVFGEQIPEAQVILSASADKQRRVELLQRALPVHNALDRAAGLFTRKGDEAIRSALLDLGNWVGTWPVDAWPITHADFARLAELTEQLKRGLDSIDQRLTPRDAVDQRVLELLDAVAEWFDALIEFRDISPEEYDVQRPLEVLRPLRKRFETAHLRAQPFLPDSLIEPVALLRACLSAVDLHACTRPRPDLWKPGGLTEQSADRNWESLASAHNLAMQAARRVLAVSSRDATGIEGHC